MDILTIKNFKCFQKTTINVAPLTILAGRNAVGKSSVIQALCLIHNTWISRYGKTSLKLNEVQNLVSTDEILNSSAEDRNIIIRYNEEEFMYPCSEQKTRTLNLQKNSKSKRPPRSPYVRYLSAERIGPRISLEINDESTKYDVGTFGEKTWSALGDIKKAIPKLRENDTRINPEHPQTPVILKQIEFWLNDIITDSEFQVDVYGEVNQAKVKFKKKGNSSEFLSSTNFGFGVTYGLPVIVLGLTARPNENNLVIIENPEAHLDPTGQSKMGQFLAHVAASGVKLIVETHSEHIINGIRIAALKKIIPHENVIFNFLSNQSGEVKIDEITLNQKAEVSIWPAGFMDQEERDLSEIFKLQRKMRA